MRDPLELFRLHLASRNAPRTVNTYGAIAAAFLAFLGDRRPDEQPARADVEAFLARPLKDGARRSPAGRNQELQGLRAFAKFALREGRWPTDPTAGVPFLREAPRDPAVLTLVEIRRLFTVAAEAASGWRARDLAIVALLSQAGLRVHELVGLDVDQVDAASATLVAVGGKGGTVHDLPLNAQTSLLLGIWLAERGHHAAPGETALLVSSRGRRLGVRSVQRLLVRLRRQLGTSKKITPHALRHSCATLALTLGTDLSTVAELLRHSDLNTTRRYLHLVDERRREAVRRLATSIPITVLPTAPTGALAVASDLSAPSDSVPPPNTRPRTLPGLPFLGQKIPPAIDAHDDVDDIDEAA